MSLALCAVLVSPRRMRPAVSVGGAAFTIAVAYTLLAFGWHYPSDVLGGFLIALALAAVAAMRRPRDRGAPRQPRLPTTRIGAVLGAIAAASLVLMPLWLLSSVELGPLQPPLLLAGALMSAAAFVIVSTYERVLDRPR
jgi:hypothetical protein